MSEIVKDSSLQELLTQQVHQYLAEMKDKNITDLHSTVLEQVEEPLFKAMIEHSKYNQSKAAEILGLSRGTLRTKLKHYFDDQYCGAREE